MLFNRKWAEPKVGDDTFSLTNFIKFLASHPFEETYEFTNALDCALAQWVRSIDPKATLAPGGSYAYRVNGKKVDLSQFRSIVWDQTECVGPDYTFGAALRRAMKMKQEEYQNV